MKTWAVTLTPEGANMIIPDKYAAVIKVKAYFCNILDGALEFVNEDGTTMWAFAPAYWVMAEIISEDGESESAANYNAYKELEKDD